MKQSSTKKNVGGTRGQKTPAGTADSNGHHRVNSRNKEPNGGSLLEKFFVDQLKDIYYAEQKIVQSLPKMKEAATTEGLKDAFEDHLHQTERHVQRLEKVFRMISQKPEGKKCEAIEGITREAEQIITETTAGTMTRDAALVIAAQKVEHYEIATYGGLVQLAITMGLERVADTLDKTLMEEEDTDQLLTDIAENEINLCAEQEGNQYSWQKEGLREEVSMQN
ncbi:MAG TPA: ferritin-like domain-containing protein [Puia sp.]|nr:ferritin-like domain-containing protein [Puia sp.]